MSTFSSKKPKISIFLLFSFVLMILYFFKLSQMAVFDFDQEFYAQQYVDIIANKDLTLLGIQTSVGGLFVGPLYTYISTIIYTLFGGNPIGVHIVTLFLLSFQASVTYWLFTKLAGNRVGILAALLFALSAAMWGKIYAPSPINLLYFAGLVFFYALSRLKEDKKCFWWLAIILGLSLHIHVSLFIFFPIFIVFLLWQRDSAKALNVREWSIFSLIILLFSLPLILFELRHDFFVSQNFHNFILTQNNVEISYGANLIRVVQIYYGVISDILFPHGDNASLLFLFAAIVLVVRKVRSNDVFKAVAILFTSTLLLFSFYTKSISDYYLHYLVAPFLFVSSYLLVTVARNVVMNTFLAVFIGFLAYQNFRVIFTAKNPYNLFIKQEAVEYIKSQSGETPVKVFLDNDPGLQFGFDYLLDFYAVNRTEENFEEVYQLVLRRNDKRGGVEFIENSFVDGIEVLRLE